jgi:predicted cupin superfamily sugar epimerase
MVVLILMKTVIPGFEYSDHDFLTMDRFKDIVTEEQAQELQWLVRKS